RLVTARFVRGRSFVFAARFGGSYHSGFEIGGTGSRPDRRLALILGRAQFRIVSRFLNVLGLRLDRPDVVLVAERFLLRRGSGVDAAVAAVVADAVFGDILDARVVRVVNHGRVHAVDVGVVREPG